MDNIRFLTAGDCAVTVEFGNEISEDINRRIRAYMTALEKSSIDGIIEAVPTYRSVTVHYDPVAIRYENLLTKLKKLVSDIDVSALPEGEIIEIPVLYGGDEGPDIQFVADHNNLSIEQVIEIHTSGLYLIYMLGFTPGFTYLGGMSEKIATPRLTVPRVSIPAGSVGIADSQTGIYPLQSPGGWQLIGRTPVKMYDPDRAEPILPKAGQYIKFCAIDRAEFDRIAALEEAGGYQCRRYPREEAAR
ncbi:MAG: 5-oxoprolinase subunit PxpB [Oscillospiraceae bacterium]|nr:5-oxoprolinase subunit PxpB [Oscillospiraceae bacterium]MBQ4538448.1 5-oxoprolinase subunit PxpB [Oscillospiraceae bacterium]